MGFITESDYTTLVRSEIKNILLEDDASDVKLSSAEEMAITQIKNYLSGRYDTETIFNAQGNDRNSHIVMITLDCTLYHLYTSVIPDQMPAVRSQRYQDAIDWLKMIATGRAEADLPKKKDKKGNACKVLESVANTTPKTINGKSLYHITQTIKFKDNLKTNKRQ